MTRDVFIWLTVILSALMVPVAIAWMLDSRTFQGVNIWIKPLKFLVSTAVLFITLAWALTFVPTATLQAPTLVALAIALGALAAFEIGYITLQAARAEASHYNATTAFHRMMYGLMGIAAVGMLAISGIFGAVVLMSVAQHDGALNQGVTGTPVTNTSSVNRGFTSAEARTADAMNTSAPTHRVPGNVQTTLDATTRTLAIGAGVGLILGSLLGTITGLALGGNPTGHWVGGPVPAKLLTDAGGLSVLGWSRTGGDLRIAHFVGMHVMQAVPLAASLATLVLPAALHLPAIAAASLLGTLATWLVYAQARAGLPLVAG